MTKRTRQYIGLLCGFVGGGDMNGITLLLPEAATRVGFVLLLIVNATVVGKQVLPSYRESFYEG